MKLNKRDKNMSRNNNNKKKMKNLTKGGVVLYNFSTYTGKKIKL